MTIPRLNPFTMLINAPRPHFKPCSTSSCIYSCPKLGAIGDQGPLCSRAKARSVFCSLSCLYTLSRSLTVLQHSLFFSIYRYIIRLSISNHQYQVSAVHISYTFPEDFVDETSTPATVARGDEYCLSALALGNDLSFAPQVTRSS